MTRNRLWLLLLLILLLSLGCQTREGSDSSCDRLWMDCPGEENDYLIVERASDLKVVVSQGIRFFSYFNCDLDRYTPTLTVNAECMVTFKYD